MKQMSRAAVLSVAIAGILSVGLTTRTVSASEHAFTKSAMTHGTIPSCPPWNSGGCGYFGK